MRQYLLKRLGAIVITLWMLATIVFMLVNVLPGDVGRRVLGPTAKLEDVQAYNAKLGTDKRLIEQYFKYLYDLIRGDFGRSLVTGGPVMVEVDMKAWGPFAAKFAGPILKKD